MISTASTLLDPPADIEDLQHWIAHHSTPRRELWMQMWRTYFHPLEAIRRNAVPYDRDALAGDPGISSMHARITQHWRAGRTWPRIWGIAVPWAFLDYAESLYGVALTPSENIKHMAHPMLAKELLNG